MNTLKKIVGGTLLASAMIASQAHAEFLQWSFNYEDAFAAEGTAYAGSSLRGPIDQLKFTAESVISWNGTPFATGSTFTDYIILRVDQYFLNSTDVSPASYGQGDPQEGIAGTHELSVMIKATGTQTGTNSYVIDTLPIFNLFFDAGLSAATYTAGTFANVSSITDGTIVETASLILGTGVNTTAGLPDGTLNMRVLMSDVLSTLDESYGAFEQFAGPVDLVMGFANSNNALCGGGNVLCASNVASILGEFGEEISDTGLYFHTRSNGDFQKAAFVPEPASLALTGLGLLAIGAIRRRREI